MIYALNGGSWWKIGPLDASTLDWQRLTSGPTAQAGSRSDVGTPPTAPTSSPTGVSGDSQRLGALTPWGAPATVKAMTAPIVHVKDFGAKGDGVTDDTAAINSAIRSMTNGGTLVFEPGKTYLKRRNIIVDRAGVKLWGYGAKILANATDAEIAASSTPEGKGTAQFSIRLIAANTAVYGLDIISNLRKRLVGHPNNMLFTVEGIGQEVIDNQTTYGGASVFVYGAKNFKIIHNRAFRTTADSIHIAGYGTSAGEVARNFVREAGDDMIAVVNYGWQGKLEPDISDITICDNDVAWSYWGRGITVSGGRNIKICRNSIDAITTSAGILIAAEAKSYSTRNVRNVVVEQNKVSRVQTETPTYNPLGTVKRTGQGAIHIEAHPGRQISGVIVRNNSITKTISDGISVRGDVCEPLRFKGTKSRRLLRSCARTPGLGRM